MLDVIQSFVFVIFVLSIIFITICGWATNLVIWFIIGSLIYLGPTIYRIFKNSNTWEIQVLEYISSIWIFET